jgi:predicted MFS family arabinose efflux permease
MMARWTAAGTLGSLSGPVLFAAMVVTGLTWRSTFVLLGAFGLGLALLVRSPRTANAAPFDVRTIAAELRGNLRATIRLPRLWRWLLLLPLADLMLDVFFGYIALFLTDVAGLPPTTAALAVTIWLLGFLAGQFLLARGVGPHVRRLIRWTSAATLVVFSLWLLLPVAEAARLAILFVLGLLASPWYPLLQGEAFAAAPGRAATVTALTSVTGTTGGILAVVAGLVAASYGLTAGLALLLVGPLALLIFTPRGSQEMS